MSTSEEKMQALLSDLQELATYLRGRGEKTLTMSKKFEENAQRDPSHREFDLNQARMLDYQHHVWYEISNMVEKILKQYEKA